MKKNCNNCVHFVDPIKSGTRYQCNGYPKPAKDGQLNWLAGLSCKHALNAISFWKPRRKRSSNARLDRQEETR